MEKQLQKRVPQPVKTNLNITILYIIDIDISGYMYTSLKHVLKEQQGKISYIVVCTNIFFFL